MSLFAPTYEVSALRQRSAIWVDNNNAPTTFQRAVIGIFSEMVNDSMEIFMDDFTPYGSDFEEALKKLEKVLTCCEKT